MDNPYTPLRASTSGPVSSNGSSISPANNEERLRPGFGNRGVFPLIPPRRMARSTSRTRTGTIFASLNRSPAKREWSVFEQRMENEGQIRTKNVLREAVSESAVSSPFQQTTDLFTRSESPTSGAPPLRHVAVDDGHDSDDASTIGYDSESDSEDTSHPATPVAAPPQKRRWYSKWKLPSLTPLQRNILKCAVAYFLGSLFTFNLTLSSLITSVVSTDDERSPSKSGHMVATV